MLRILTLSTLFPDATRPNFGVFVERQTLGLAARPGVKVTVVAPIGLPPTPLTRLLRPALLDVPTRERWKGLDVHRPRFTAVSATGGRWHARLLERALVPVLDAIRDDAGFDVIDASFFFPDGPAAVALGRRYGVPVSIKARGADIHHWGRAAVTRRQVLAAGQAADGLLAVSEAMRADMVALGMPGAKIRVHHTGIDRDRFCPGDRVVLKQALGVAGPLVLSLGALIPRKGHDIVIEAVATLPGVTLIVAGQGPEQGRLAALAARLGISDRVRLVGPVQHAAMPDLVAAADLMALASASEGLANAWVEALSCGTPIVITDAGGAREVVTSGAAGRVVRRDPTAFAGAIADVLARPPAPELVRETVAGFSWEANATALAEHLARLVARGQASSG
ncbi:MULTISPECIES: glycosyltransferase [unclassified Sphingomonas]|uniref:glycosyltransferase n=1 Tax=unclassified Sphingomonas TaxID=196159 RepID=UPI002269F91E|nr:MULTISPECIES: glycosyltransferase [unclassified Sphingomonas]